MKREKFNKLFEMGWEENPKNGKPKRVARYIGKYYRVELAARDRARPWLIAEGMAALALFLVGGLVNNLGSHCAWVVPFYAVTVLPVFYFLLGVGRLCRGKERITQMDLEDGIQRGQRSALSLTVLGALWVLSDLVFLIARGAGGQLGRELIFMLCGAATGRNWRAGREAVEGDQRDGRNAGSYAGGKVKEKAKPGRLRLFV